MDFSENSAIHLSPAQLRLTHGRYQKVRRTLYRRWSEGEFVRPVLLIHGGAGSGKWKNGRREQLRSSVARILKTVYPLLIGGKSSLEAVTRAVMELEDDPLYNAGRGAKIQSDGHIRLSASVMDGKARRFAGCVNVEGVKNPILLAKALLKEEDRVLAGMGAKTYARRLGLKFASPMTPERRAEFERKIKGKTGTVGAVAIDKNGRLAAATSTGGKGNEIPHRVSDSPTTAGNFANADCAVSATGIGEQIMDFSVAANLCSLVEAGVPLERASRELLKRARRQHAEFGFIALNRKGEINAGKTTPTMIWGACFDHELMIGF